jgi:hypothetical protein
LLADEIESLKLSIAKREFEMAHCFRQTEDELKPQMKHIEYEINQLYKQLDYSVKLSKMKDVEFHNHWIGFNEHLDADYFTRSDDSIPLRESINRIFKKDLIQKARTENNACIRITQQKIQDYERRLIDIKLKLERNELFMQTMHQLMSLEKKQIVGLSKVYYGSHIKSLSHLNIQPKQVSQGKKSIEVKTVDKSRTVSGLEVAYTTFDNCIDFPGVLGSFLGSVERHRFALALTGDAGAGKSEFSFRLAKIFALKGFRVLYYSLEMGINLDIKNRVLRYRLTENFDLKDKGSIDDLRIKAGKYDCIIVDSFSKLEVDADELDRLRNEFPQTFFIFIFQKTTTGTMRGGTKVIFDCTMNIDITRDKSGNRIAEMIKSRYGTLGWKYIINEDKLIK